MLVWFVFRIREAVFSQSRKRSRIVVAVSEVVFVGAVCRECFAKACDFFKRGWSAIFLLGCFLLLGVSPAHAIIDASLQMQLGNPSGATADTNNHDHFLIQRSVEAIDYSDNLGEPVWASWDLTAADIGTNARSTKFFPDTSLPSNFYQVTDNDYNGVGTNNLNRGHMCPSEDRTDTRADNDAVFLMSNIVPQNGTNNSGVWGAFESFCRGQTASNELLIICGPSGFGMNRIPSGKAVIPNYVWKIVVIVPTNSGPALSRIASSNRVIALKIPNTYPVTKTWPNYVTSAAEIEVDTGFTFFTALPPDIAAVFRNKVDGQTNPPPAIFAFSPTSGAVGTNVIITGTNFSSATAVTFSGTPATFNINSTTQIVATVPVNAGSGFVSVTTPSGTAISADSFTVLNNGGTVYSGLLAGWDVSTCTNYGVSPFAPSTNAADSEITGLARGKGVNTNGGGASRAWGGLGFTNTTAASAIASNQVITFIVTPDSGYKVAFTRISRFDYYRSSTGPTTGVLQYQVGSGAFNDITNLSYPSSGSGASIGAIDLSNIAALQNIGTGTNVTFRIVNYGGGPSGTWYIYDTANSTAPDLSVQGIVTQVMTNAPALPPTFTLLSVTNNQFQFTVNGTTGSNYVVQAATNLAMPDWISLITNPAPFVFADTNVALFPSRFYRVIVAP